MSKKIVAIVSLALALCLGASGVWAALVDFPDNTLIQVETGAGGLGGWQDVVGTDIPFKTFNATFDTVSHVLTMFTNWGPGNFTTGSVITFFTADLFLNYNPNTNTALAAIELFGDLGTTSNKVFSNPTNILTSEDLQVPSGLTGFGGRYTTNLAPAIGPPSFKIPITTALGAISTGTADVIWTANPGDPTEPQNNPLFSVAIDLDQIAGFDPNDLSFLWATSSCGNDVLINTVPLPPSLLLLGSGLLGLVGLGLRRKSN